MNTLNEVLFEELPGVDGMLGIITLNRPAVLNSLNIPLIRALHSQLQTWATASHIKAIVIRAVEGRAFCAGGDLRSIYEKTLAHDPDKSLFFHDEYLLNSLIFHYPKPYVALLDGITMGGGVGISIHGSHRIATDKLMFAMPETGIGFFPDVGGTYFLPRLPGRTGFYLGLTGARLDGDDCVALGIVQQKVASAALPQLIDAIAQHPFGNNPRAAVTEAIEQFKLQVKPWRLAEQQTTLDECFSLNTMEEIVRTLTERANSFCEETLTAIAKKSPTSLKVTLHALQKGKHMDFDVCMRQEYRLTCRFLEGHDFIEGIRAVIIDKDQKPIWQPHSLTEVKASEIEKYFAPLNKELA